MASEEMDQKVREQSGANPTSQSTGEVASGAVEDVQRLVNLQVELAKQEVKEIAVSNAIGAGSLGGAGLLALIAILAGIPVLVVELVPWHWQAAAVWVVLYLLVAAGLALFGKGRLRLEPPRKTLESLKENKEWALRRMKSAGS